MRNSSTQYMVEWSILRCGTVLLNTWWSGASPDAERFYSIHGGVEHPQMRNSSTQYMVEWSILRCGTVLLNTWWSGASPDAEQFYSIHGGVEHPQMRNSSTQYMVEWSILRCGTVLLNTWWSGASLRCGTVLLNTWWSGAPSDAEQFYSIHGGVEHPQMRNSSTQYMVEWSILRCGTVLWQSLKQGLNQELDRTQRLLG